MSILDLRPASRAARGAATVAACLVAYAIGRQVLPSGIPLGIALLGIGLGLLNALGAVGLILVYRAGRYVNFAQAAIGAAAASFTFRLIAYKGWNWYVAVLLGLVVGMAIAGMCELLFVQRLFTASRLVVTIATVGISQFATFFGLLATSVIKAPAFAVGFIAPAPPFNVGFSVGPVRFDSAFVLVFCVVPVVLAALALFMKKSRYGLVIEAGAQNVDRARLVGVSVRSLSTAVWLLVGFLGALAAILSGPITNLDAGSSAGASELLYALAPAMIAGLDSIPVAVAAALGLGIVQQALAFNYTSTGPIQLTLFLVIVVVLFLRRAKLGVGGRVQEASLTLGSIVHPFPRELRRDRLLATLRGSGRLACLAVAVIAPLFMSVSHLSLASVIVIYALAALSLTVLTGYTGQVSFGQWALVGFGGLLAGNLATQHGLGFWPGVVLIPLGGAALAVLVGISALQLRGVLLGVTTLAFAVAASGYLFGLRWFNTGGYVTAPKVAGIDLSTQRHFFYLCLLVLVLMFVVVGRLGRSTLGRNMAAVRDNSRAASAFGISVFRTRLVAFAISGFIASLAGYLYLYNEQQLGAGAFDPNTSLTLFAAVIIGGVGTRMGAVVAALFLEGIASFLPGVLQEFASSVGLLFVLMVMPQGVSGIIVDLRDVGLRWYAARKGIRLSTDPDERPGAPDSRLGSLVESPAGGDG
ncbi:MAG TPA: ABC transporter permease [Gaiellaceae bacterium]|nr:ABC transporter permease [Gaiellaceae bacterium]